MLRTLLCILSLPLLFHLLPFLCLLHIPIFLLDILRRSDPCIFNYLLAPFPLLSLSLHIPALNIYLGVDGRMIIYQLILQILINGLLELLAVLEGFFYLLSFGFLLEALVIVDSELGESAEVVYGVMEACSLVSWIILL